MPAVDQCNIFLREGLGNEFFQHRGACCGLRACLDDRRIAPSNACREHAERQEHRKIERGNDQRNAVGHFINSGHRTGKAHQTAEMPLRSCPFSESSDRFIDLNNDRTDVAQVCLYRASAQILMKCRLKLLFVRNDSIFQFFQLLYAPFDIERFPGTEVRPLFFD